MYHIHLRVSDDLLSQISSTVLSLVFDSSAKGALPLDIPRCNVSWTGSVTPFGRRRISLGPKKGIPLSPPHKTIKTADLVPMLSAGSRSL